MTTVNATHDEFKEEVFSYLDELRESGITNMFGAGSYIEAQFNISSSESSELLGEWMSNSGR